MPGSFRSAVIAVMFIVAGGSRAAGQASIPEAVKPSLALSPESRRVPAAQIIAGAVLGSAVGLMAGFAGGGNLGWGGGDDPGLGGAVLFAGIGSVLGTAVGIEVASAGRVPFGASLSASTVSVLAGVGAAVLLQNVTDGSMDEPGVVIGFSVGQGLAAGAMTSGLQVR